MDSGYSPGILNFLTPNYFYYAKFIPKINNIGNSIRINMLMAYGEQIEMKMSGCFPGIRTKFLEKSGDVIRNTNDILSRIR